LWADRRSHPHGTPHAAPPVGKLRWDRHGTNFRKPVIKLSRPGLVAEVHIVKNTEAFL
jgi:hypothetical protein